MKPYSRIVIQKNIWQ